MIYGNYPCVYSYGPQNIADYVYLFLQWGVLPVHMLCLEIDTRHIMELHRPATSSSDFLSDRAYQIKSDLTRAAFTAASLSAKTAYCYWGLMLYLVIVLIYSDRI